MTKRPNTVYHWSAVHIVLLVLALVGCDREARPSGAERPPSESTDRASSAPMPADKATAVIEQLPPEPATKAPPAPEERVCTTIGCVDGFIIDLYPSAGWPAGEYRFVIKHDRKTTICRGRIPLPPCERSGGIVCDGRGVSIGAIGCAGPPDRQAFGDIEFNSHPASIDVDVLRNGVRLAHAHYYVEYETYEPNGPGCGTCRSSPTPAALTLLWAP